MDYKVYIETEVKRKREKYNLEELFHNPLIHRQINGQEIYVPLDPKRLWGA